MNWHTYSSCYAHEFKYNKVQVENPKKIAVLVLGVAYVYLSGCNLVSKNVKNQDFALLSYKKSKVIKGLPLKGSRFNESLP